MFIVKNPSEVESMYVWATRLGETRYLALPLDRDGRDELQDVGDKVSKTEWMSPYGDILRLDETDFGVYALALNSEVIGTRLLAEDIARLVSTIETSRPLICWKRYKSLPTKDKLGIHVRIGFAYKAKAEQEVTVVSVGRIQPAQIPTLEKFGWDFGNELKVPGVGILNSYTGLGINTVLLNGDPVTVSELLTELRNKEFITYELRDIR